MARATAMGTTDTEVVTGVTVDTDLLEVTCLIPVTVMGNLEVTVATWRAGMLEKKVIYKYLLKSYLLRYKTMKE